MVELGFVPSSILLWTQCFSSVTDIASVFFLDHGHCQFLEWKLSGLLSASQNCCKNDTNKYRYKRCASEECQAQGTSVVSVSCNPNPPPPPLIPFPSSLLTNLVIFCLDKYHLFFDFLHQRILLASFPAIVLLKFKFSLIPSSFLLFLFLLQLPSIFNWLQIALEWSHLGSTALE